MSDLTTLDLWSIFHDAAQLGKLHEIQQERCELRALTAGARPAGLRLSIADPIRRVKAAIDPWWLTHIDEGIAERGFLMEDLLEVGLLHGTYAPLAGKAYQSQVAIRWHERGTSAFDWVVQGHAGGDRVVSCKSKDPKGRAIESCKPSSANVAQEKRMMTLAGYPPETTFEVWLVDPSTLRAAGPHEYTLTDEDVRAAGTEAAAVIAAFEMYAAMDDPTRHPTWNDPAHWERAWGLVSTSGAFKYPRLDASGAIEARVRAERRAAEQRRIAEAEYQTASDLLFKYVDEQIAAAREVDPLVKAVTAYAGDDDITYGRKSNGAKQITVRPRVDTGAADAA